MEEGYYMDNGTSVNLNSISIPSLCLSCLKNSKNNITCNLNRIDQAGNNNEFKCFAYEKEYRGELNEKA